MLLWVVAAASIFALLGLGFCVVQVHIDPSEKGTLTKWVASLAMFIAFCALFLLPIDVFSITQAADDSQEQIKVFYYGIYLLLAVFAFLLLPFAYFLYEEDDGSNQFFPQAVQAAKYSLGISGVTVMLTVLILCANFQTFANQSGSERVQSAIAALMGIMLGLGLMGYVTYTAYGLGELPLIFFHRPRQSCRDAESDPYQNELLHINAEIGTLQTRYLSTPERLWPPGDKLEIARLRDRQTQLALQCDRNAPRHRSLKIPWVVNFLKKIIGFCLGCFSLLIVISLVISLIDKVNNSECGFRCGFDSNQLLANPISLVLIICSDYFPLDLIVFSFLMFYLFAATLTGLSRLGVRLLFIKLYSIRVRKTKQNALLMGVWFMIFFLLAINTQTLVLVPHYATFGNQRITDSDGKPRFCRLEDAGDKCSTSVLWKINNSLFNDIPIIGGLTFFSNILFIFVYSCTMIWVSCAKQKSYIREIDEADDFGEYLIS